MSMQSEETVTQLLRAADAGDQVALTQVREQQRHCAAGG
jgi:hypothetical protein